MATEETTPELPKRFEHAAYGPAVYRRWLDADAFAAVPDERDQRYVIMMPLPNVTGALHMGHAMDNVMQDLLIRWHRMRGENSLWMPGTDHAGIATQAVVEKRLYELEGKTRQDIGRDALVQRIWEWKDEYQQRIVRQQQSMGCSCDWARQRFTLDAVCARATQEAFFRLFRDGLIYRGDRLVNWDCQLQTAVSDDEIIYETVQGYFWHIRYPIIDPKEDESSYLTVATTRPETMLGDTAIACHPYPAEQLENVEGQYQARLKTAPKRDWPQIEQAIKEIDYRRDNLLADLHKLTEMAKDGRKVRLPLLGREIPLILDQWAKPELGSGCVKITPGHDANDYEVWSRHREEIGIINILNPDGTLNANAGPYNDLDRFEARSRIVADLQEQGLLEASEARQIEIGHSDRSKTPIEPYLSKQWFIKMGDLPNGICCGSGKMKEFQAAGLAQAAIDAIAPDYESPSGRRLTFYPDHARYGATYRNWLAEKRDWCISRQLWWGHRIPIWHCSCQRVELDTILARLPAVNADACWVWISDSEGNLHAPTERENLQPEPEEPLDVLVCLRDQAAESSYAPELEVAGLRRDPDVLDTWFSSALWPFSTLGWPDPGTAAAREKQRPLDTTDGHGDCLQYYYPGSCLVTGRDIITLWVARMLVMGLYLLGDVPFSACFVHANIQDGKGERMSKSKGNGIDPEDIIQMYGADAMRYVLCDMQTGTQDIRLPVQAISPFTGKTVDLATAKHGRTIFTYICPESGKEFDVLGTMKDLPTAKVYSERFEEGQAFCTKLWNAVRFALMNLGRHDYRQLTPDQLHTEDRWILSRLSRAISRVSEQMQAYSPSSAISTAREFFWAELCDWYLEIIKPRLKDETMAPTARSVLALALDQVLRLLHPFLPFITEVLWERLGAQCPVRGLEQPLECPDLAIAADWPAVKSEWFDKILEEDFALAQSAVGAIRELRSRYGVSPKKSVLAMIKAEGASKTTLEGSRDLITHMAGLRGLEISADARRPATAATQVVGECEIYVAELIDPLREKARLTKQHEVLSKQAQSTRAKLDNTEFLSRAPARVVETEQKRYREICAQLEMIQNNLHDLSEI